MRRARLGLPFDGQPAAPARASTREAMWLDISQAELNNEDYTLLSRRVAMFTYAPALLAATHMIVGTAMLVHG